MEHTQAKLNLICNPEIDRQILDEKYTFIRVECDNYSIRANVCDDVSKIDGVVSVKNIGNMKTMYVMGKKDKDPGRSIIESIRNNAEYSASCAARSVTADDIPDIDLLQIMLNSLHRPSKNESSVSVSGRYFQMYKMKNYPNKDEPREIVTLELFFEYADISNNLSGICLSNHVVTFTNIAERKWMTFTKRRPFEMYPQYILTNYDLKRKSGNVNATAFIIRKANKGKKNNIDFVDFSDLDKLDSTKSRIIFKTLDKFNQFFRDVASIEFRSVDVNVSDRSLTADEVNRFQQRAVEIVKTKPLFIINKEGESGKITTDMLSSDLEKLGLRCEAGRSSGFDCFRIDVVHNEEHFKDDIEKDTYSDDKCNTMQHVTIESYIEKDRQNIAETMVEELSVKDDINHGVITLYDWTARSYSGDYVFAIALPDEENDLSCRYATLSINPNGSTEYSIFDLDDDVPFPKLATAVLKKDVDCSIMDPNGNINSIRRTNLITMVDADKLRDKLLDNQKTGSGVTTGIRTEEGLMEYLPECIDINTLYVSENCTAYYVGVIGKGMDRKVKKAAIIREVVVDSGSVSFIEDIMNMMAVPFVRHDQTTVLPFPVKYLREWISMRE